MNILPLKQAEERRKALWDTEVCEVYGVHWRFAPDVGGDSAEPEMRLSQPKSTRGQRTDFSGAALFVVSNVVE